MSKDFTPFGVSRETLEQARRIATEAIENYGDWQDEALWKRFREQGIWNDHVAVQASIATFKYIQGLIDD